MHKRECIEIDKQYNFTESEKVLYKKHFDGFFPAVKNGDEILMQFNPHYGAKFYYNGKFFGEITNITLAIRNVNILLHPNATFKNTRNFFLINEQRFI